MPGMSGSHEQAAEYADHEVQQLYVNIQSVNDGVNNDQVIRFDPVGQNRLDSDELAELVGMYRSVTVGVQGEQEETQTQVGYGAAEYGLGINLVETEFTEQLGLSAGAPGVTVETDEVDGGVIEYNNQNEAGALDTMQEMRVAGGAAPTTDQTITAGSGSVESTRTVNFRDLLGSGPYVDKTDEITVHLEAESVNFTGDVFAQASLILYWDVQEMPEGRASFARP